jgi:hypothetical protein
MTTIIYQDEIQNDIEYFKTMRDRAVSGNSSTEKIDKQIAILEDAVVIYKLAREDNLDGIRITSLSEL